ncbi:MAG: caspase family protein [Anaerolineae bacterium]|nr:caspase family protein [Anaerolineae bacterium]
MEYFEIGYALVIGVDANKVAAFALPDVAKDVAVLREVLVHAERCAYREEHVKTITGEAATRQGILDGLEWLGEQVKAMPEATAIIYYSGHGFRHGTAAGSEFFLIPYDIKATSLTSRALRASDFAAAVGEIAPRRLLVVLDCCHAAGMQIKSISELPPDFVGTAIEPGLLMTEKGMAPGSKGLEALAQGRGRAVLSSSTGEQESYIRQDGKMSVFTYHFIEALTGHAQPQAGAREVLVSDVISYVHRKVPATARAEWGRAQTPDYQVSGNFSVALLLGGKGLAKSMLAPSPESTLATPMQPAPTYTAFDQRGQTVHGSQTNIQGDAYGSILSGQFDVPVSTGGGDAVGMRGSRGAVNKPKAPVSQHYGDSISITGDGNVVGNNSQSTVIKNQTAGITIEAFQRLLEDLLMAVTQAGLDRDVAETIAQDLDTVQTQVAKPKPNAGIIVAKLGSVLGVLGSVDGVWGLAERLRPMVEQALQWAKVLFK